MIVSSVQCKQDVVFLLTQPPSPPEEPAPPSPSKDKDSSAIKKKPSKGKAAAGGQQVDCKPPSLCLTPHVGGASQRTLLVGQTSICSD